MTTGAQQQQGSRLGPLQVTRQGAGRQHGGRQQGACTVTGWQQVDAQQQGLHTTAVQDDGQQVMGRQQPSCRPHGSQHTGLGQGWQMGRVQRGTQVTGRHTVVWQDTGRQQQGSRMQQGCRQPPPQLREEKEPQQDMVELVEGKVELEVVAGAGSGTDILLLVWAFIYPGQASSPWLM